MAMAASRRPPKRVLYGNAVPFSTFVKLVCDLGKVKAQPKKSQRRRDEAETILTEWIRERQSARDSAGIVVLFFRLFFPEQGARRRYDMKEQKLAVWLQHIYGKGIGSIDPCLSTSEYGVTLHAGCLGAQVRLLLRRQQSKAPKGKGREMTLGRIDQLLDQLASFSEWSADDVRAADDRLYVADRSPRSILAELFRDLDPDEAAVMCQIILRDLRPLLYPPPSSSSTLALLNYNTAGYCVIDVDDALKLWNPELPKLLRANADLDYVAWQADLYLSCARGLPEARARLGLPVKVPKTEKPGSCEKAARHFKGQVAAEVKYDGERLQIHVDTSGLGPQIRIFSKSGRESTKERKRLLPIIQAALGLPFSRGVGAPQPDPELLDRLAGPRAQSWPRQFILEGEMVPFDEDGFAPYSDESGVIAEFWRLGFAKGADDEDMDDDAGDLPQKHAHFVALPESYETGGTGVTPSPRRLRATSRGPASEEYGGGMSHHRLHLMIVWFDCLLVDEESLLNEPYEERRSRLESLITEIRGYSLLAERRIIDFGRDRSSRAAGVQQLRAVFADAAADKLEGLMLKPITSRFNDADRRQRWVKLKKDYIPGLGDTLDFYVIGATCDMQRARELMVPPGVLTTFFVGVQQSRLDLFRTRADHYHVLFSVSYGLNREQLALLNSKIHATGPLLFDYPGTQNSRSPFIAETSHRILGPLYTTSACDFAFSIATHLRGHAKRPRIIFRRPIVFELYGAGFQKSRGFPYYELRWPRISKVDREADECDPVDNATLQAKAADAIGAQDSRRRSAITEAFDAFGIGETSTASSLRTTFIRSRQEEREYWIERLEKADGVIRTEPVVAIAETAPRNELVVVRDAQQRRHSSWSSSHAAIVPTVGVRIVLRSTTPPQSPPPRLGPSTPVNPSPVVMRRSYSSPAGRAVPLASTQRDQSPGQLGTAELAGIGPFEHTLKRKASKGSDVVGSSSKALRTGTGKVASNCSLSSRATEPIISLTRLPALADPPGTRFASLPSSAYVWTILRRSPALPACMPRHPALDYGNFVKTVDEVLRLAGHAAPSAKARPSPPCSRDRHRNGIIFVDLDSSLTELATLHELSMRSRQARVPLPLDTAPSPQPVLVLRIEAYQTFSMYKAPDSKDIVFMIL